ncbi:MAG TPA: STAS domain-containing protein [Acidimicrobiales bacterium]|nr:STAS domain-containing protein [Acidimicrobiales bacterium]
MPDFATDVTVVVTGETATLAISGDVDIATAPGLREQLERLEAPNVVVDLSGVTFIDSTGLGVLVGALKRAKEAGGQLTLRSPSRSTRKVLDITGLSQLVAIED